MPSKDSFGKSSLFMSILRNVDRGAFALARSSILVDTSIPVTLNPCSPASMRCSRFRNRCRGWSFLAQVVSLMPRCRGLLSRTFRFVACDKGGRSCRNPLRRSSPSSRERLTLWQSGSCCLFEYIVEMFQPTTMPSPKLFNPSMSMI